MDAGAGEPGWDPEASAALPPGGAPARLPVLPGERAPAPGPAGAPALVPAGQGTAACAEPLAAAALGVCAPQGQALTSSCFMGKQDTTPFSPVGFLYTCSLRIVHTFITPLSNELESTVASRYKPTQ